MRSSTQAKFLTRRTRCFQIELVTRFWFLLVLAHLGTGTGIEAKDLSIGTSFWVVQDLVSQDFVFFVKIIRFRSLLFPVKKAF